jgi:hypothetical protein
MLFYKRKAHRFYKRETKVKVRKEIEKEWKNRKKTGKN